MKKQFVHIHCHDERSNNSMFESITSVEDYIEKSKEYGNVPAISISNHGNVVGYVDTKRKVDESGLKYIHAIELYVTEDNNKTEKLTRDNFHLLLLAKNWEGVKEINRMSSDAFNRNDNHFHYKPRVFFEELKGISDNVIISTACLGSPLWQHYSKGNTDKLSMWMDFFLSHKDNVYLEVQPHEHKEQKEYNQFLLDIAKKHDMKIVATNDVHNLDEERNRIAKIIKESKGIIFDQDDDFNTIFLSRDDMEEAFKKQGVLTDSQIEQSLDNTVEIANRVEDFEFDRSIRYPQIFNRETQKLGSFQLDNFRDSPFTDSLELFRFLIAEGYIYRGLNKRTEEQQRKYKEQVLYELDVYIKTKSIDYMLLEYTVKKEARDKVIDPERAIFPGYARGSVGGSLIAYLLRIIDVDPIKYDLVFERFMSESRVGNPDIDSDWMGGKAGDKEKVQMHLLHSDILNCASIMTQGTLQEKGSVKAIGKALGYSSIETNTITKLMDLNDGVAGDDLRDKYPDIFELSDVVSGSVGQFGRHASAILVSNEDIRETIGLMTLDKWDAWVTQQDMDSIDYLNELKLDILGVDNIGLINNTSEMIGLPRLSPDSDIIDLEDDKIWDAVREDTTGIFQFESDRAGKILRDILAETNVNNLKEKDPNFSYINLVSLASAAQRPSGSSYVSEVTNGVFNNNGHPVLDEFLAETQGFLVYQEQQMKFLTTFAKFDKREADTVRKGIAKKKPEIMEREVPKIKPAFVKTMVEEYGLTEEEAGRIGDEFIVIFMNSMNYSFGKNHSIGYALISAVSAWLRYHYPLQYLASALEIWKKGDKHVQFLNYADRKGIKLLPPKFRKSKGNYYIDEEENSIYEGTSHIKGGNGNVGDIMFTLKDRDYPTFTDLILDVIENGKVTYENKDMTIQDFYKSYEDMSAIDKVVKSEPSSLNKTSSPLGIDKTKMEGLIKLNYFEEFGQAKKLMQVYEYVKSKYKPNNKTFSGKQKRYFECIEYEKSLPDEPYSIVEQCENELALTGRVTIQSDKIPAKFAFVTKIENQGKTRTTATVYSINKGSSTEIKVGSKVYRDVPFNEGDLIELQELNVKAKRVISNGSWIASPTEKELWVKQLRFIRKTKVTKKG